ncbi:MAG: 50S ribosomal protein L20 [Candidatus Shapirobacteria bacterium]|jgi:large subunit ribosomal protein L20
MRVKTGIVRHRKHKKILEQAKGFWMTRHKRFKVAKEAVMHSGQYAYEGRRIRRRDMRQIWIVRLNAALASYNLKYSVFIAKLKEVKVELNRKMLADISVTDPATFKSIINTLFPTK